MNINFTDGARRALAAAKTEAIGLRHGYVGTEHLLLGLLRTEDAAVLRVLDTFQVVPGEVRRKVADVVRPGKEKRVPGDAAELPFTSRGKKVLELMLQEVRKTEQRYATPAHLLLALLREEKGIAAEVLVGMGLTVERARAAVIVAAAEDAAGAADGGNEEPGDRRDADGRLAVEIDDASDRSIYEQIVAQVQEQIATGALHPEERLPPVRRLADQLDVAPGTVARAYAELERLGLVVTQGARGTRVASRSRAAAPAPQRTEMLIGLLRPVVVAAFHLGATADELRGAMDEAMRDIFGDGGSAAA